ncbi:hypothetical protein X743_28315 [Mesorhizobium sp. LNHC252B00]|nr:hypothetical protein X743_28315 [Mesorhizobium sp. LNHC252B00]
MGSHRRPCGKQSKPSASVSGWLLRKTQELLAKRRERERNGATGQRT